MKKIILTGAILSTCFVQAQHGIGTNKPNKSSVLDLQSSKRGLLIPRLELKKTTEASPVLSPANSLLVYNTATVDAGDESVSPGYYYWNGAKWVRMIDTDSQVETEWAYNSANERIELKKSETPTFANKVFYDKEGGFKNLNFTSYENYNYIASNWETIGDLDGKLGLNMNSKLSSKIDSYVKDGKTTKVLSENMLLVDEKANSSDLYLVGSSSNIRVKRDNAQNYNFIKGVSSEVSQQGAGDVKNLVAGSFDANINQGKSTGYVTALRTGTQVRVPEINNAYGITGFIIMGQNSGTANRVTPANFNAFYRENTAVNVARNYVVRASTELDGNGVNATIGEAAGFYYEGVSKKNGAQATIGKHYGVYLDNVDGATENYAIYSNSGKVRVGDLADGTVSVDRIVGVDTNGVLKATSINAMGSKAYNVSSGTTNVTDLTGYSSALTKVMINATIGNSGNVVINLPDADESNLGQTIDVKIVNTSEPTGEEEVRIRMASNPDDEEVLFYGQLPYQSWLLRSNGTTWEKI